MPHRSLSRALKSLVRRDRSGSRERPKSMILLPTSKSSDGGGDSPITASSTTTATIPTPTTPPPPASQVPTASSTPSSEELDQVDELRDIDEDDEQRDELDLDAASSIIGGHSTTRAEQAAAHVPGEEGEDNNKTFSFSLPFANPLAIFDRVPRFSRFFTSDNETLEDKVHHLQNIDSRQEEELYRNIHQQDNPRLRAVRLALTPNRNVMEIVNPLSVRVDPVPQIDGDVVILGGYRGSILRDRKTGRRVWIPIKVGFNLRKIDLTVGLKDEDEWEMEKYIYPDRMLTHIGPVDVARKLIRKLSSQPNCRVHEFAYDWRLSADINSKKLTEFLRKIPSNKKGYKGKKGAIVIAHSMGGLIAHHATIHNPDLVRGLVYAGVPSSCPNILGPLRYGDSILLSSRILTAQVNFLMRSSFVFLPTDGKCFVDRNDPEKRYDLDFFDVEVWKKYEFSPCVSKSAEIRKTQVKSEPVAEEERSSVLKRADSTFVYPTSELLSYDDAIEYLDRTLKRTKKFLDELWYDESKKDVYPPMAVIYGCTVPTLKGSRVDGPEGIKQGDYNDLIFGAGDGVIYHKSLMPLGKGFPICAKIPSDRGHVSLLNDVEGVGRTLRAILDEEEARSDRLETRSV